MGIFDRLFGGKSKDSEVKEVAQTQKARSTTPSLLIKYFDKSERVEDLFEMIRTRSVQEIEELCKTFPIETLHLDWGSVRRDFLNFNRFEKIICLVDIFVRYEGYLKDSDLRLPRSFPAEELAEILMSRLMPFIADQEGTEIAEGLKVRLYDFAMALINFSRDKDFTYKAKLNRDALTCLRVSRPSIKEDHEFWIFVCYYNIASATKKPEDITAAIREAEEIISGKVRVPEKYVQTVGKLSSMLQKML